MHNAHGSSAMQWGRVSESYLKILILLWVNDNKGQRVGKKRTP